MTTITKIKNKIESNHYKKLRDKAMEKVMKYFFNGDDKKFYHWCAVENICIDKCNALSID